MRRENIADVVVRRKQIPIFLLLHMKMVMLKVITMVIWNVKMSSLLGGKISITVARSLNETMLTLLFFTSTWSLI